MMSGPDEGGDTEVGAHHFKLKLVALLLHLFGLGFYSGSIHRTGYDLFAMSKTALIVIIT